MACPLEINKLYAGKITSPGASLHRYIATALPHAQRYTKAQSDACEAHEQHSSQHVTTTGSAPISKSSPCTTKADTVTLNGAFRLPTQWPGKLIPKYKENCWGVISHSIGCGGAYGCCEESEWHLTGR